MGGHGIRSFTVFCLTIYATITVRRVSSDHYKLGVLLPYDTHVQEEGEPFDARFYAAAVSLAVDDVNNSPRLLPHTTLSFVWNNTQCNRKKMVAQQQWQIRQGVVAFIGPSCHARKAAKVAARKRLAVISFGSQNPRLSNKLEYPNFARTNPSNYKSVARILAILEKRGWRRVTIVQQQSHFWHMFKRYLTTVLRRSNIEVSENVVELPAAFFMPPSNDTARQAMDPNSNATIFLSDFQQTQEILTILQRMDMLDKNRAYGFIGANFRRMSVNNWIKFPFKWFFSMFHGPVQMNVTKKALKRLLLVTLKPEKESERFKKFQAMLKMRSPMAPFYSAVYKGCIGINGKCVFDRANSKPPYIGVYLYNAVVQLALALDKLQKENRVPTGPNVIEKLKGSRFTSIDGRNRKFDRNADIKTTFTVLGLKKDIHNNLNMVPLSDKEILDV